MTVGSNSNAVLTQTRFFDSLGPDAPGTLRHVLHGIPNDGAGYVVRPAPGLSGVIDWSTRGDGGSMLGDTIISKPGVTLLGDGRITVTGGTLQLSNSHQRVSGFRFLSGDRANGPTKNDRDTIRIGGGGGVPLEHIRIDHNTIGWGIDGNLDLWDKPNRKIRWVTVEENIIAECLKDAGHPEGFHSTCVLIGGDCLDLLFYRNLWSSCSYRVPAACKGVRAAFVNEVYSNFNKTVEFYDSDGTGPTHLARLGTVTVIGPDKSSAGMNYKSPFAGSTLWQVDNITVQRGDGSSFDAYPPHAIVTTTPNLDLPIDLEIIPASEVLASVCRTAGPPVRTALENRLCAEPLVNGGSIKANIAACPEAALFGF